MRAGASIPVRDEVGTCRYCGCTDRAACSPPCWWIDKEHTACSAVPCVDKYFAEHGARVQTILKSLAAAMGQQQAGAQ